MKGKVYGFLGDGSYITSKPFADYCRSLQSATCEVEIVADSGRDTGKVCVDIVGEDRDCGIILIGYSLGANGCAWVQSALVPWCKMLKIPVRPIELIVGFDPTSNGPALSNYPIGSHVKKCICFHQTSYLFPSSLLFGHGVYTAAPGGPQIETIACKADHLWVQASKSLQTICSNVVNSVLA